MRSPINPTVNQKGASHNIWRVCCRAASLARLKPFDTTTERGRSDERMRRVFLSAAASAAAKAVTLATALISIPLTLKYLGSERYGMWMVMSSLTAMLSFADLGVGNGVLNLIAAAHGRDDRPAMRQAVSSGFAVLSTVAVALLLILASIYHAVPWPRLFNVSSPLAEEEAGPAIAIFLICFATAIPVTIVQRVQIGLQKGYIANMWQCVGSVSSFVGVLLVVSAGAGLPWLVLAYVGGPLVSSLANSLIFFTILEPDIAPRIATVGKAAVRSVMQTGAMFFALQLIGAVTYNSDNLIIAQIVGPEAVPQYAVPERLFSVISLLLGMTMSPFWAAYREALTRGDLAWVRLTLIRTLKTAVLTATILSILLLFVSPFIIRCLAGTLVVPPFLLLCGLALWKIIEAVGNAIAIFLNGAQVIAPQLVAGMATALLSIGLEVILVRKIGVAGAVWATVIAYCLFMSVPYAVLVRRFLATSKLKMW